MINKKIVYLFIAITLVLTSHNSVANNLNGPSHTYAMLLSSGDSEKIRLAAEYIYYYEHNNTALLDIAAEVLLQGSQNKIDIRTDSMSWLAKLLGRSGSKRYLKLLKLTKKNIEKSDEANSGSDIKREFKFAIGFEKINDPGRANIIDHSKTLNYIEDSIEKLATNSPQEYLPGDTDLVRLKDTLKQSLIVSSKKRTDENFLDVTSRHDFDHVHNTLGAPDSARIIYHWYKRSRWAGGAWVSKALSRDLELSYKKLGTITFFQKDSDKPLAIKRVITTISEEEEGAEQQTENETEDEEYSEQKELVDSIRNIHDGAILSRVGYRISYEKLFTVVILDAMIKRVSNDLYTTNGHIAGAYSIFLKNIGSSGNKKYIPELQLIMKKAKIRKIKKWAKKALEMLGVDPNWNIYSNTPDNEEEEF